MLGKAHAVASAGAGIAAGTLAGFPVPVALATGVVASVTGHGWLSPDADLKLPFVQHRGTTHWPGWPLLALTAAWWLLPHGLLWLALGVAAGWLGHDLADAIHGAPGMGRGPGIPFRPRPTKARHWHGLGLKVGGLSEWVTAFLMLGGSVLLMVAQRDPSSAPVAAALGAVLGTPGGGV